MALTYQKIEVLHIEKTNIDTLHIQLKTENNTAFEAKPGQYITLRIVLNGIPYNRAYSISSNPYKEKNHIISVKKVENGIVSNYLFQYLQKGSLIEVLPPTGRFVFEPFTDFKRKVLLLGAGSGITPLMSIIRATLPIETQTQLVLLYGNRNENSIVFEEELNDLSAATQGRLRVIHRLSQASPQWKGKRGRWNDTHIAEALKENNIDANEGWIAYVCGPKGMIESAERVLLHAGFSLENIKHELFENKSNKEEKNSIVEETKNKMTFKVIINKKEYELPIESHQTILDAAEKVDAPFSCTEGVCTTCMAKVIEGQVDMTDTGTLSPKEISQGYILTCQTRVKESGVKVTFDF
jgi:ring-1,2-phenylacetyl-CoA epoxidase subunit PaaE